MIQEQCSVFALIARNIFEGLLTRPLVFKKLHHHSKHLQNIFIHTSLSNCSIYFLFQIYVSSSNCCFYFGPNQLSQLKISTFWKIHSFHRLFWLPGSGSPWASECLGCHGHFQLSTLLSSKGTASDSWVGKGFRRRHTGLPFWCGGSWNATHFAGDQTMQKYIKDGKFGGFLPKIVHGVWVGFIFHAPLWCWGCFGLVESRWIRRLFLMFSQCWGNGIRRLPFFLLRECFCCFLVEG